MNKNNNDVMSKLGAEIIDRRYAIKGMEDNLKAEKEVLRSLEDKFRAVLSNAGLRSVSYGSHYLAVATRQYVAITDMKALLAQLKKKGLRNCIVEMVDKKKFDIYAKEALRDGKQFAGTEISKTEYLVVREKKD